MRLAFVHDCFFFHQWVPNIFSRRTVAWPITHRQPIQLARRLPEELAPGPPFKLAREDRMRQRWRNERSWHLSASTLDDCGCCDGNRVRKRGVPERRLV